MQTATLNATATLAPAAPAADPDRGCRKTDPDLARAERKLAQVLLSLQDLWAVASAASSAFDDLIVSDLPRHLQRSAEDMRAAATTIDWQTGATLEGLQAEASANVLALAGCYDADATAAIAAAGGARPGDAPAAPPSPLLPDAFRRWAIAIRALALAEEACDRLADTLDDLPAGDVRLIGGEHLADDARHTSYFVRAQMALVESSAPPEVLRVGGSARPEARTLALQA